MLGSLCLLLIGGSSIYWLLAERFFEPYIHMVDDEAILQIAHGPIHSIAAELMASTPQTWPELVAQKKAFFGDLIRLNNLADLHFSEDDLRQLSESSLFVLEEGFLFQNEPVVFHLIPNSSKVLSYGPLPNPEGMLLLDLGLQIGWIIVFSLLLFLWVGLLYRKLQRLQQATDAFGEGNFSVRTHVSGKDLLGRFGLTFDQMADRIVHLLKTKSQLIQAVSHELRTPLSRLTFAKHFLQEKNQDEETLSLLNEMSEDIGQLENLVQELLHYGQLEFRFGTMPVEILEAPSWLSSMIARFRHGTSKHLELVPTSSDEMLLIRGIPQLLEKAFSNLLQNSLRYGNTEVIVGVEARSDWVWFTIDDDGPGISVEDRERIWEPFTRLETSRQKEPSGWGLGMTIVKRIVEWHHGKTLIDISPQGGTRISIGLRRCQESKGIET